jgi:hypothetical protein
MNADERRCFWSSRRVSECFFKSNAMIPDRLSEVAANPRSSCRIKKARVSECFFKSNVMIPDRLSEAATNPMLTLLGRSTALAAHCVGRPPLRARSVFGFVQVNTFFVW